MEELRLLHLDEHLVAVDKPAGLLVHRTRLADADDQGTEPHLAQPARCRK